MKKMRMAASAFLVLSAFSFIGYQGWKVQDGSSNLTEAKINEINKRDETNSLDSSEPKQKKTASKDKPPTEKEANESPDERPSWTVIAGQYEVPVGNLAEEVKTLLSAMKNDSSGRSEYKLAYIADYCDRAPKTEEELWQRKKMYEESSLLHGDDNAQTMQNIERASLHYEECRAFQALGLPDTHEYFEASADKGYMLAKAILATAVVPENYEAWTKDEQKAHKKKMTEHLFEARANCEPRAFYAVGHGLGEGELWEDDSEIPIHIRKYGNLLSYGMIFSNKSRDSKRILDSVTGSLKTLAKDMQSYDIESAEEYGRNLYKTYCN